MGLGAVFGTGGIGRLQHQRVQRHAFGNGVSAVFHRRPILCRAGIIQVGQGRASVKIGVCHKRGHRAGKIQIVQGAAVVESIGRQNGQRIGQLHLGHRRQIFKEIRRKFGDALLHHDRRNVASQVGPGCHTAAGRCSRTAAAADGQHPGGLIIRPEGVVAAKTFGGFRPCELCAVRFVADVAGNRHSGGIMHHGGNGIKAVFRCIPSGEGLGIRRGDINVGQPYTGGKCIAFQCGIMGNSQRFQTGAAHKCTAANGHADPMIPQNDLFQRGAVGKGVSADLGAALLRQFHRFQIAAAGKGVTADGNAAVANQNHLADLISVVIPGQIVDGDIIRDGAPLHRQHTLAVQYPVEIGCPTAGNGLPITGGSAHGQHGKHHTAGQRQAPKPLHFATLLTWKTFKLI